MFRSRAIDERLRNPWPEAEEEDFQARARRIIAAQSARRVPAGNTYFENEKRTYGFLMAQALGTRGVEAVRDLEVEDAQAAEWHSRTEGIDFYAAFTLKHQVRKYFHFGGLLSAGYRDRMLRGARAWTEADPLHRPHPAFRAPGGGWGPDARNSWVDVRSTENLFLMRVTSVYLFAEEAGNTETALRYRKIILDYTKTLYRVGIGEWDSENYHGHSIAPLANLYDFAKDTEVKLAAKACLDFFAAAGAVRAPLAAAWDHLSRVERWPSWARHIREAAVEPPGPLGPASRGTFKLSNGVRTTFRVVEFQPPRSWKWVGSFLGARIDYDHVFEPVAPEETRIRFTVDSTGGLTPVLGGVFGWIYRHNLERAIPRLVAEIEADRVRAAIEA